jgi:hypothetical protein
MSFTIRSEGDPPWEEKMVRSRNRRGGAIALGLLIAFTAASTALAQKPTITEPEAQGIANEAYLYFYPLITMDLARKQATNVAPGKEIGKAPMNSFASFPEYPSAGDKRVVRFNFDTLSSSAWLDLTSGPVVVSAPDTAGRYYLLPMLDMWTDVFASPGWRTTGTAAANFLVTPPGWTGTVPSGMTRIDAPTPLVWIVGRTQTDGPRDYAAVHKIQAGYKVTPLSEWGNAPKPVAAPIDPTVDMKTPPKVQVERMPAAQFFAYAAELLKVIPPHLTDQPMIALLKKIGIEPGKSFQMDKLDPDIRDALSRAPEETLDLMEWKLKTLGRSANGWLIDTDTVGVYGNDYLKRALIAQQDLGATLPEDAIDPLDLVDDTGKALDGAEQYTLHFGREATPPALAFWSITLYDAEGFPVANPLNRFALSSWMPFKYNADGSLDLYVRNESPGAEKEANWLPTPKGAFSLTMRIYAPKAEVLLGQWNPPPLKRSP